MPSLWLHPPYFASASLLAALERRKNKTNNSFEDWAGIGLDECPSYNLTACDVDDPSSLEGKQIHQTSMIRP